MSIINNLLGRGYYQLFQSGGQTGGTGAGHTAAANAARPLADVLAGNSATAGNEAYLLNLSPQAQQYLNSIQGGSATASSPESFLLNAQQRQTIADILAQYKDAPYSQDTFNQIQNDLNAAGLGADTLSMIDQMKSFNPTAILVNALNGGPDNEAGMPDAATQQGKVEGYIQSIVRQWQTISGQTSEEPGLEDDTAGDAVAPVGSGGGA